MACFPQQNALLRNSLKLDAREGGKPNYRKRNHRPYSAHLQRANNALKRPLHKVLTTKMSTFVFKQFD